MIQLITGEYRHGEFVYAPIELEIPNGIKKIGVFGPNGSGKTTFLKILEGALPTSNVCLKINDIKLSLIDYIPQSFSISNQFILTDDFVRDVFALNGLQYEVAENQSINELLPKRLSVLSGGEVKRLLFWLANQKCSQVILLDEVLANLDPKTEAAILDQMKNLVGPDQERLIFFSSHQREHLLEFADWFIGFKNCKVEFSGTKEEFIKQKVFEALHEI